jgi:transcriptional regulator with XRE-family HTH domain
MINLYDSRGERVGNGSLTEQERVVEARRTKGETYREIAEYMGLSYQRIQQIDVRVKAKREGKIPMSNENRRILSEEEEIKVRDHPLRVLRKQMGYTQTSMAKAINRSQPWITKIEHNKCSERLLRTYVKELAAYFKMDESLMLKDTLDWISSNFLKHPSLLDKTVVDDLRGNPKKEMRAQPQPQVEEDPDFKYLFECQKSVIEAQRQTMVIQQQLLMSKDFSRPKVPSQKRWVFEKPQGMVLREWLRKSGVSANEFAKNLNIAQPTLSRWMSGKALPTVDHAVAIEAATGGAVSCGTWRKRNDR